MNTILSSVRVHSLLQHRSSSSVWLEKLPRLSARYISNSCTCLAKSEKENEGFMSRLKNIFGKSSERNFRRMIVCHGSSGTVDKNTGACLYHFEKYPIVWQSRSQQLVNFCPKRETASYRQMSLLSSLKSAFGLNPRNSKPAPIREPNIPQKPVKDNEKDKKHKKPVVQTEENSEEEVTHVRSAMMDEHGNPVTEENFVRTEWGVRVKDQARKVDPHADAMETIEKPFYIVKSLWGVNVKHFMTRDEAVRVNTAVPHSKSPTASAPQSTKHTNKNLSSHKTKSSNAMDNFPQNSRSLHNQNPESKSEVPQATKQLSSEILPMHQITKTETSRIRTKGKNDNTVKTVKSRNDIPERKPCSILIPSNISTSGIDRKMPKDPDRENFSKVKPDDEINAWKDMIKRSINRQKEQNKQAQASLSRSVKVSAMFIQPKSPELKRDVIAVPSSRKRHPATGETYGSDNAPIKVEDGKKPLGRKKPSVDNSKFDKTTNKKLHTSSTSTPYCACKNDTSIYNLDQLLFMDNSLKMKSKSKRIKINDNRKLVNGSRNFLENNDLSHSDMVTAPEKNKSSDNLGSDIDGETSMKSNEHSWGEQIPHNSKDHAVKAALNSEDLFERVQTIHPDVTPHPKEILGASEAVRNEASRLVQEPLASVSIKSGLQDDPSLPETNIRQQIPVDLKQDAITYELKNYAYLRPDEIKEMRPFLIVNQISKEN